jgi:hypothetical protein
MSDEPISTNSPNSASAEIFGPQMPEPASAPETNPPLDNQQDLHPVVEPSENPGMTTPAQAQITPQMLIRYFNQGTNEVIVPASVEFTPPVPKSAAGGSSATYISN